MTNDKELVNAIRSAWVTKQHISTLPRWGQVQKNRIELTEAGLKNIDKLTRSRIVRNLLFALRCQTCERKLSEECNFSICIRGLMSGTEGR